MSKSTLLSKKSGMLSKLYTFHSIGTFYSKNARHLTEKEKYLRQRQTYASRAQRNRSLFALYQKKIEDEQKKRLED